MAVYYFVCLVIKKIAKCLFNKHICCNFALEIKVVYYMNKHYNKTLAALKPKIKALGFNKKEVEGIAAQIADNLSLEDEASEDDINTAIDEAIDAALPFLKMSQSVASRIVADKTKAQPKPDDDDDTNDDDDDKGGKGKGKTPKPKGDDDEPKWAKELKAQLAQTTAEITALKADKVSTSRKERLEELLKDCGVFGKSTLSSFSKMTFKDDDEFDEFFKEVEENVKSINQERADAGLSQLGSVPSTEKGAKTEPKELSDKEIESLASHF